MGWWNGLAYQLLALKIVCVSPIFAGRIWWTWHSKEWGICSCSYTPPNPCLNVKNLKAWSLLLYLLHMSFLLLSLFHWTWNEADLKRIGTWVLSLWRKCLCVAARGGHEGILFFVSWKMCLRAGDLSQWPSICPTYAQLGSVPCVCVCVC